ncbi:LPP20 family lipoprotein [Zooshikella ganghwensis]|uniref:LPP20 family lipoprotein n=1 Tax=Zooshikella ganghwensis TaxID=202772 RepID=UPI0013FD803A|nr:LPP20 family lipoprotein [Zooshikella ganghwensis]
MKINDNFRLFTIFFYIFILSGCVASPKRPDWLTLQPKDYPEKQYVIAVGEADTQHLADSRALANLAKFFEVNIADVSSDFSQTSMLGSANDKRFANEQKFTRQVNTETKQVLEGVRVVERYKSQDGRYYSLAVLKKSPLARRLRKSILAADRNTNNALVYAQQQATNPLVALATLEKARHYQLKREADNQRLSVLTGRGITSKINSVTIQQQIQQGLSSLRFAVDADKKQDFDLLTSVVSGAGISISDQTNYSVELNVDKAPVSYRQGWYWLRGSAELVIYHDDNGLAKKRWPFKVSSQDESLLEQRLNDHLVKVLPAYFYSILTTEVNR